MYHLLLIMKKMRKKVQTKGMKIWKRTAESKMAVADIEVEAVDEVIIEVGDVENSVAEEDAVVDTMYNRHQCINRHIIAEEDEGEEVGNKTEVEQCIGNLTNEEDMRLISCLG